MHVKGRKPKRSSTATLVECHVTCLLLEQHQVPDAFVVLPCTSSLVAHRCIDTYTHASSQTQQYLPYVVLGVLPSYAYLQRSSSHAD